MRPAAGHGIDQLRVLLVHLVRDGELYRIAHLFHFISQPRKALSGHLGEHVILPFQYQPLVRLDFQHFAAIGRASIRLHDSP